jgi:filamin
MAHLLEAKGDALQHGVTGEWNKFVIETRTPESKEGALGNVAVSFDGLAKPNLKFQYEQDKVIVLYKPLAPGDYKLGIRKCSIDIPGSPFLCSVKGTTHIQPEKIKFQGDALTQGKANQLNEFIVDASEANISGKLKVAMEGPTFSMLKYGKPDAHVIDVKKGVKKVQYTPKFTGKYKLHLEFEDSKIPGSPFQLVVE